MRVIVWCLCILLSFHAFAEREGEAKVGDQSPDFKYEDKDGKIHSLKEFKGKYVLIDFWATYCAPCKGEIPYLEKIQEKFKKKKIAFVGISIDTHKDAWIQFLKQNPLKGTQLIFDLKDISFIHAYQVTTIPRYVLLDKEGKIINLDMPRPSNPEFVKILGIIERIVILAEDFLRKFSAILENSYLCEKIFKYG